MEYYDLSSDAWHPYSELKEEAVPINRIRRGLEEVQNQLSQGGVASHLAEYALFDIRFYETAGLPFVEHPLVLLCDSRQPRRYSPVVVRCPRSWQYDVLNVKFFGLGVHHLPTYRAILRERPPLIREPMAAMKVLAEGLKQEEAGTFLLENAYLNTDR